MRPEDFLIILNLFFLESMLSVDNAAVLAILVKELPEKQRNKALRYGIAGAYIFRGFCLIFASLLYRLWYLRILGALYLLFLTIKHFRPSRKDGDEDLHKGLANKMHTYFINKIGHLWTTVIVVEIMDLSFSIDNIFAAVALSDNIVMIIIGVSLGILAMRFIAGLFVKLMTKYPSMEHSAFIVIGLLALKLLFADVIKKLCPGSGFDIAFSACTMVVFFAPILWSRFSRKN